jgi:hypothetical protein
MLLAGLLVGLGLGTTVAGGTASLPGAGTVPGAALGLALLAAGGLAYFAVDRRTSCDCDGDCGC